ncbi:dihydroneopterin aldolase [Campylobacter majalis]|uniref:dihydroneopterin aldolase n=1 Tax=Campylobacter majalis TaxID=2790656 RepID=UPI003D684F2B
MSLSTIIKEYEFDTIIGVYDFEREKTQKVRISVEYMADGFVDYVEVMQIIKSTYDEYKFMTVEESLRVVTDVLKQNFKALISLNMEIYKLEIVKNATVGAKIHRKY